MLPKDILNSGKLAVTAKIVCRTGAILLHFSGEHKVMWSLRRPQRHRTQKKGFFSVSSPVAHVWRSTSAFCASLKNVKQ